MLHRPLVLLVCLPPDYTHSCLLQAVPMPGMAARAPSQPGGAEAAAPAAQGGGSNGDAAWPGGPPLDEMQFNMGAWGDRRRRSSRGGRRS